MTDQEKKQACYDFLTQLGIAYSVVHHDCANTIEACHEVEKTLGCEIIKNLLLTNRQMTQVYMLLMPGDKAFKTKYLSSQVGCTRLSFATPEQMLQYVNITPGSLSVMGLMFDKAHAVRLLIDRELLSEEYIGCHPCVNTSSMRLKLSDILERFLPAVGHEATFVDLPWPETQSE